MVYYFNVRCIQNLLQMIMAQGFRWRRSEDVVSRVACGLYHFNPCSQTTVKRKENTKNENKNIWCPRAARAVPRITVS